MRRIYELVALIEKEHSNDHFFANLKQTLEFAPEVRAQYRAYERALSILDLDSWNVLRNKALEHFIDHGLGQRKQGFFNQLNEAFAYEHLIRKGFQGVQILRETGKILPDIQYTDRQVIKYCEVKTVGISDDLIARRESMQATSSEIYYQLSAEFLNKLRSSIDVAADQLRTKGSNGLIYLLMLFDDFTLEHYKTYRKQVTSCIQSHPAINIHIKVGILGRRYIPKGSA